MATIIDTSGPEPIARSNIELPADARPLPGPVKADKPLPDRPVESVVARDIKKIVVVVDNFLAGEQEHTIEFVLDERFRDQVDSALAELIDRAILFQEEKGSLIRDKSRSISFDLNAPEKVFASIVMKHDLFRDNELPKRINTEFTEL